MGTYIFRAGSVPYLNVDHFSSPQWVDLVRGVLPGDVRAAMERHLHDGCGECVEAYGVWRGLAAVAEEDRLSMPPEEVLSAAKACWRARPAVAARAVGRHREKLSLASAVKALLVFDSLNQALPVGVRAGASQSRHLLYAASPLAIDLHLDPGSQPGRFLLAGQIADSSAPDTPPRHVTLTLFSGDVDLLTFEANSYGEFQCEFEREHDMKLVVSVPERAPIVIPLDSLFEPWIGTLKSH